MLRLTRTLEVAVAVHTPEGPVRVVCVRYPGLPFRSTNVGPLDIR